MKPFFFIFCLTKGQFAKRLTKLVFFFSSQNVRSTHPRRYRTNFPRIDQAVRPSLSHSFRGNELILSCLLNFQLRCASLVDTFNSQEEVESEEPSCQRRRYSFTARYEEQESGIEFSRSSRPEQGQSTSTFPRRKDSERFHHR